jgi:gliding motility-associated-like protein
VIIGTQLLANFVFDFETKTSYTIQIQSNDGNGGSFDKQFIVQILDSNDAPNGISLNSLFINENLPANTFIGNLTSNDPDAVGSYSYSFVAGAGSGSNSSFMIRNDSLFSNASFDFENGQTKGIRIRTTDNGGLFFDQAFTINILDQNDLPTAISLSNLSLSENLPSRATIGYLSTTDQDALGNFSYSFVSGTGSTDNASFNLNGNELRSNAKFNYETKSNYSIRVKSSDGLGGAFEEVFTITVIDSNDMPTNLLLSNTSITENRQVGSIIGYFDAEDEDNSDNFTYSFFNGASNDNGKFILVNNQLRTGQVFNYEDKSFHIIYVKAEDNSGLAITKQFVIGIIDSNDIPTALELSSAMVAENEPASTFIGLFTTTDADQFTGFNYSLVGGAGAADNGMFKVSNDSLYTNSLFNYESRSVYSIRLRSTDASAGFIERSFEIGVSNQNDAPSDIIASSLSLIENASVGSEIGTLTSTDEDPGETFEYSFASGSGDNHNASFKLIGAKLVSNFVANYEVQKTYSIRIKSSDKQGLTTEKILEIAIVDEAENPSSMADTFSVSETAGIGTVIGTVSASSPDVNANLIYQIQNTTAFKINAVTGQIELAEKLDYEAQTVFNFMVKVTDSRDSKLNSSSIITVYVLDEVEANQKLPVSNVVSPNGDGLNDAFMIDNIELYQDYSLTIYNNSGLQVYQTLSNYQNNWEGTFEGTQLPSGVYFYVFTNKTNEFKGSINIIR